MKKALVTITSGKLYEDMAKITHPLLRAYADRIGAEFIVLSDWSKYTMPHYLKLELGDLLSEYDRILYMDTDIIIRPDTPNIFDVVPADVLGIFEEGQFMERQSAMYAFMNEEKVNPSIWNRKYYNTGVMVLSKCHSPLFLRPAKEKDNFKEQTYLNVLFSVFDPKVHNLHYKWNRMYELDKITGEERFNSYFIHYAGLNQVHTPEFLLDFMKKDIQTWEKSAPAYSFPRNIAVKIEGGLGDQICAIPSVRYMQDRVYKGDNLILISDFPEAFNHVGLPVYKAGEKINTDKGFHQIHTMRSPDHISWEYMSHPLCHAIDFASLQAIRMMLPLPWKKIDLKVDDKDIASLKEKVGGELKDLVILHPGRGWDSKNFPPDVWRSWLQILLDKGYRVAIFGKHISNEQGIVEFDRSGSIDLVNKLSMGEMFALVSQAKVLISNDSAPIHVAGAFDNWIGVIATCKKPDYILPYRNGGNIYYKAKALEIGKLYDKYSERPTDVYGETIDKCTEEEMRAVLPPAENILAFVKECFNEDQSKI